MVYGSTGRKMLSSSIIITAEPLVKSTDISTGTQRRMEAAQRGHLRRPGVRQHPGSNPRGTGKGTKREARPIAPGLITEE